MDGRTGDAVNLYFQIQYSEPQFPNYHLLLYITVYQTYTIF
jgi:hypothetical protein